ncbi:MAG: hypothetical protein WC878_02835 [Candidatus Paceibacterota bacterium]|jgi:hypothetical protein
MEPLTSKKEINALRGEHLANGERPIIACVEGYDDEMTAQFAAANKDLISKVRKNKDAKVVDFKESYSVSPLNNENKFSLGYVMCTGVVGVGKDKWTDENISFLSHQFPAIFLPGEMWHEKFVADLRARLEELKESCISGSVDVVIVGGEYNKRIPRSESRYVDSVNLLKNEVVNMFGFEPVVITGPKLPSDSVTNDTEDVLFDTANRRLYISRPKTGNSSAESYLPGDIEAQSDKWKNKPNHD